MLRYRQIAANSRLCQHQMAANLASDLPASFLERLRRILTRNVRQLAQRTPFLTSNDMHNFGCTAAVQNVRIT